LSVIDLRKTVYELCSENENVADILSELGFKDITKPGMINTAGRFMTIPKGAKAKGFNIEEIKKEFIKRGYEIKE
jgi:hypothetical protein